jgi:hypothetical protein
VAAWQLSVLLLFAAESLVLGIEKRTIGRDQVKPLRRLAAKCRFSFGLFQAPFLNSTVSSAKFRTMFGSLLPPSVVLPMTMSGLLVWRDRRIEQRVVLPRPFSPKITVNFLNVTSPSAAHARKRPTEPMCLIRRRDISIGRRFSLHNSVVYGFHIASYNTRGDARLSLYFAMKNAGQHLRDRCNPVAQPELLMITRGAVGITFVHRAAPLINRWRPPKHHASCPTAVSCQWVEWRLAIAELIT